MRNDEGLRSQRGPSSLSRRNYGYKSIIVKIGIIGGDDRAVAIGRMLSSCGHTITFSDPTSNEAATHAAQALGLGAQASTAYEQAAICEAIVLAIHWQDLEATLSAIGTYKDGLIIDATRPPNLEGTSGAELLAHKLDNRHVVKAFVTDMEPGKPIQVASNDPEARAHVESVITKCGGIIEDLGPLSHALEIERGYAESVPTNA